MGMNRRIVGIVAVTAVMAATLVPLGASTAQAAPVGNGFTLTVPDLQFILDQIKIAEAHKAADKPATCTTGRKLRRPWHEPLRPWILSHHRPR